MIETVYLGTSGYPLTFLMIDSTNHIDGKTGLTPTVYLSKAGAAGAVPAGSVSEVDSAKFSGLYKLTTHAADLNTLGPLWLHASATGADPYDREFLVVAYNPQNSGNLGLLGLPSGLPGSAAGMLLSANASNQANINMSQSVSATNTAQTVGDSLNAARAQSFGKWIWNTGVSPSSTLVLYAADDTVVRTFQLDSIVSPTRRI